MLPVGGATTGLPRPGVEALDVGAWGIITAWGRQRSAMGENSTCGAVGALPRLWRCGSCRRRILMTRKRWPKEGGAPKRKVGKMERKKSGGRAVGCRWIRGISLGLGLD